MSEIRMLGFQTFTVYIYNEFSVQAQKESKIWTLKIPKHLKMVHFRVSISDQNSIKLFMQLARSYYVYKPFTVTPVGFKN